VPTQVQVVDDLVAALLGRGVELRLVPNLWPLRDAVISSTLRFSMIRMRNALQRGPTDPSLQPAGPALNGDATIAGPDKQSGGRMPLGPAVRP